KLRPDEQSKQDPTCQRDRVVDQSPDAGTNAPQGSTVTYHICVGPGQTTVPQVIGLSKDKALKALQDKQLQANFVDVDNVAPSGQVVGTDHPEGSTVDKGTKVTLQVSRGNLKEVPSLVGLSEADAKAAIAAAGFTGPVKVVDNNNATQDQVGKVTSQNPGPKAQAKVDATITIIVGRSVKPSPPPSPTATAPPPPPP